MTFDPVSFVLGVVVAALAVLVWSWCAAAARGNQVANRWPRVDRGARPPARVVRFRRPMGVPPDEFMDDDDGLPF